MKRVIKICFAPLIITMMLSSCSSWRKINYIQDAADVDSMVIQEQPVINAHKGDKMNIYVSSRNQESASPFNLTAPMSTSSSGEGGLSGSNSQTVSYQVDDMGNINFPQIGVIHCEGMNQRQLANYIKDTLIQGDYLKDPIVTVEFLNMKVSVLGEVAHPGSYEINNGQMTLLDALSMAGDLSIYGRRDRVAVIREYQGQRTIVYHDLRSKELFNSPYYYLNQNDIVYVEPNHAKAGQRLENRWNQPSTWASLLTATISLITLIRVFN